MDFSNVKKISIDAGEVKQIAINGVVVWKGYTNLVPTSIDTDGKVFNGVGYKDNSRLNSSAAVVNLSGYTVSGYIKAKAGDVIRVKGLKWDSTVESGCYFWNFNSKFEKQKDKRPSSGSADINYSIGNNGELVFKIESYADYCEYIRISGYGSGADMIITVNEEI